MLKKVIKIQCMSDEDYAKTLVNIHEQLAGNEDYVNSNIILNDSETRRDSTENEIRIYIFEECKEIPKIVL